MAVERFMRKGTTRFYLVPTIADPTAPTVAEIGAGDRVLGIATVNGFSFANTPIDTPDFESTFTTTIPGEDKAPASSFEIYERQDETTIYDLFPKGTSGFIVIFPVGIAGADPAADDVCDVWPVDVTSRARVYTADNMAAKFNVDFTIPVPPTFDSPVHA